MFIVPEITAVGWLIYALLFFGLYVTVVIFIVFLDNVADLEKRRRDLCTDAGDMPPLTILIPAFNEEAAIAQSIQGAVDSEYPTDKLTVLVIDDGSTDQTAQIVKSYADQGVCLLQKPNSGKAASVNHGLKSIDTPYVLIIDADTHIRPDACAIMMEYMGCPGSVAMITRVISANKGIVTGYGHRFSELIPG